MQEIQQQINELKSKINDFQLMMNTHHHEGITQRVNIFDIFGLFQTISFVPTVKPNNIFDQVKIYVNSTTYRLYIYDFVNNVWHYVTLT